MQPNAGHARRHCFVVSGEMYLCWFLTKTGVVTRSMNTHSYNILSDIKPLTTGPDDYIRFLLAHYHVIHESF